MPRGFTGDSTIFFQILNANLKNLIFSCNSKNLIFSCNSILIQYVHDFFLCSRTCYRLLTDNQYRRLKGDKVSRDKRQQFRPQVRYLRYDIPLKEKTLSPKHIKTFLNYPLPKIKRQLISGFSTTLWGGFLNFSARASPVYSMTKEIGLIF